MGSDSQKIEKRKRPKGALRLNYARAMRIAAPATMVAATAGATVAPAVDSATPIVKAADVDAMNF